MKKLENFLQNCTTELDTYNMDECISILRDDQGGEVARADHINSIITCEPFIWIGEKAHSLSEKEIDYIIDFLFNETEDELRDWESNYECRYEDKHLEQRY